MVVCAVRYEPVSTCNSLLTGKLTGNFAIPRLLDAISVRKAPVPQRFPGKFPTKINREIISRNREFFAGIREFRVTDVSVHFSHTCSFDVRTRSVLTDEFASEDDEMSDKLRSRERYGEAFWRAHHEAWRHSELQREYCDAYGIRRSAIGVQSSRPSHNRWRARCSIGAAA
jgi:hypothetical protein